MKTVFAASPSAPRSGTLTKSHHAVVRASVDWSAYASPIAFSEWRGSTTDDVRYDAADFEGAVASVSVSAGRLGDVVTCANVVRFEDGRSADFCLVVVCQRF